MPHMLNLFVTLLRGDIPHTEFTHSYISVIPKPGKDPSIPDNYRPIALLNSGYRIFTEILSSRLSQFIPKLINRDQVGFMPSRHAGDKRRRTIDLIDLLNKFPRPALVLSLDAQKAFDRLSWPYMFSLLLRFGFQGPFLEAIWALYTHTSHQIP